MVKEMSNLKRALACVYGKDTDHISSANGLVMTTKDILKGAGATYPEAHTNPQMMADLAAMSHELTGIEGVTVPFDISLEAEVLGAELDWRKSDRPPIKTHPVKDPKDFVIPENISEMGRIPVVLKSIEILKQKYEDKLAILPTTIGPFTILGHIAGVDEMFCMMLENPDNIHILMDKITDFIIEYQKLMIDSGSDILFLADPTSSGDLISGEMFREFVTPYLKRISNATEIPKIIHICGNTAPILEPLKETGIECFSADKNVPIWYIKKKIGDKMTIYGNLDVIELLPKGSPDEVYKAAQECIYQGVNFVGTACDVPENTPLENIIAFVNACKETEVPTKQEIKEYIKKCEEENTNKKLI